MSGEGKRSTGGERESDALQSVNGAEGRGICLAVGAKADAGLGGRSISEAMFGNGLGARQTMCRIGVENELGDSA